VPAALTGGLLSLALDAGEPLLHDASLRICRRLRSTASATFTDPYP
jgi:hypothetical protein